MWNFSVKPENNRSDCRHQNTSSLNNQWYPVFENEAVNNAININNNNPNNNNNNNNINNTSNNSRINNSNNNNNNSINNNNMNNSNFNNVNNNNNNNNNTRFSNNSSFNNNNNNNNTNNNSNNHNTNNLVNTFGVPVTNEGCRFGTEPQHHNWWMEDNQQHIPMISPSYNYGRLICFNSYFIIHLFPKRAILDKLYMIAYSSVFSFSLQKK